MIPNWLIQRAYLTPNKMALSYNNQQWTFNELKQQAMKYAGQLKTLGIQKEDRIALLGNSNAEMVFIIHAGILLDLEIVMLNNRLTSEEIAWQLEDAQVTKVLFDDAFKKKIKQFDKNAISFSKIRHCEAIDFSITKNWNPHKTITIMYTSGTTGFPKGVRQTAENHTSSALSSVLNLGLDEHDCWLCTMPLFHISGFSILVRSVIYGMEVRLYDRFDLQAITDELIKGKVTRMSVVSVMLSQILRELEDRNERVHPSFKTMLAGGGSVPIDYLKRASELGMPILQTYGMTETSSQTATLSSADALRKLGSAGKPLFFNQIKINKLSQSDDYGEIHVKGPHVTPGYIGQFEQDNPLEDGWLPTGDIGYLDEEGYLYIIDRRSDLIISGGENVYPAEIENVLAAHSHVAEAGVCGKSHARWGETPVAFVVAKEEVSSEELIQFCKARLAKYKVPTEIMFVPELPRNASNKLLRRELKKWLHTE